MPTYSFFMSNPNLDPDLLAIKSNNYFSSPVNHTFIGYTYGIIRPSYVYVMMTDSYATAHAQCLQICGHRYKNLT